MELRFVGCNGMGLMSLYNYTQVHLSEKRCQQTNKIISVREGWFDMAKILGGLAETYIFVTTYVSARKMCVVWAFFENISDP